MSNINSRKLILRHFIRDTFGSDPELKGICNSKERKCRGGSERLYELMYKFPRIKEEWMNTDKLLIVSGIGHTFLRYYDDKRFIYIDPTIGQFVPSFDGIFVGDEQDLRDLAKSEPKLDLGDYLGPDYEGKKYPLPPLSIETVSMERLQKSGLKGGRRRSKKSRRTKKYKRRT